VHLALGSRPTHPCSTAVGTEACSTLQSSNRASDARLNNCYYNQDLHHRPFRTDSRRELLHMVPVFLYTSLLQPFLGLYIVIPCRIATAQYGQRAHTSFGVIRFRSRPLQQVSCYTRLSGFQPSWPPSCYLQQATSFVGSEDKLAL